MTQRPTSVTRVVQLVWALVALATVLAALTVVFEDDLVRALGAAGTSADDTRVPPSFAPVAVVLAGTVSCLLLVQLALVVGGHPWARHSLAVTVGLVGLGTVSALTSSSPPLAAVVGGVLGLVLEALVVVNLYRPGTAANVVPAGRRGSAEDGSPVRS
ncbi:hypothetical protein [Nocardioides dongxiaopingii]|uniref:hypothetical protein n=1 Tax=Nocardioides dongxiaopingii TaxID=2576036 RepID=UPI0010C76792|nr:hypothetical protein [Nocardioides dongxiaopingii]